MNKENIKIKRALLSVSDKEEIVELAKVLASKSVEIISTGGTKKKLEEAGIKVTPIESVTGNPEAFGGRMKTISFQVGSALLFRRFNNQDLKDSKALGIEPIDLVVCNLYPFEDYVKKGETNLDVLIENIDIGGPTMIRAAAKNYEGVTILTNPNQYKIFCEEFETSGEVSFKKRKFFSLEAFRLTASYDLMVNNYLTLNDDSNALVPNINLLDSTELRYGENSHQRALLYKNNNKGIAHAVKIQGKDLSYNNLLDADAAWKVAGDASLALKGKTSVSVIKHLNPCGLAVGDNSLEVLELAWAGDPVSAFGGIIATTCKVTKEFAEFFDKKFIEVLIAPDFDSDALDYLSKKKNLRVLKSPNYQPNNEQIVRSISGGMLIQNEDEGLDTEFRIVTKNNEIEKDHELNQFGIMAAKHLKSNAIAFVLKTKDVFQLVGAGMGQPNRIDSLRKLCLPRIQEKLIEPNELTMISDAFFPFADTIEVCAKFNIKKIIQPGGSIRDDEVIKAADQNNISMLFTGRRHFRH